MTELEKEAAVRGGRGHRSRAVVVKADSKLLDLLDVVTDAIAVSDLVLRWHKGWELARGRPPVERVAGGLRVHYGRPGMLVEFVVLRADEDSESLRRLAIRAAATPDTVLTVPTNSAAAVRRILTDAGLAEIGDEPEALMSTSLAGHPDIGPQGPYRTLVADEKSTISVRVLRSSGDVVARGALALSGADAIPVDVVTEPGHRRRGLGSVVMSALVQQAVGRGATTGILVASPQGRQLYSALGWIQHADVVVARSRPDSSA